MTHSYDCFMIYLYNPKLITTCQSNFELQPLQTITGITGITPCNAVML